VIVLYAIVTIALQYSLAGGQGMVSSNTITASLSHNTQINVGTETFTYLSSR